MCSRDKVRPPDLSANALTKWASHQQIKHFPMGDFFLKREFCLLHFNFHSCYFVYGDGVPWLACGSQRATLGVSLYIVGVPGIEVRLSDSEAGTFTC